MLRSMYSGVSGLRTHQIKLDVIGNNIANVNTVSFKASNISFQEVLGQTLAKAKQPSESGTGGTNPSQVGLGVSVGSITTNHTNGSIQSTDNPDDLAIDGNGFFIVSDGLKTYYTRAGNFTKDTDGTLVTGNGEKVLGWNKGTDTSIDYARPLEPIVLSNLSMPSKVTNELKFEGNIDCSTSEDFDYNMTIYDSLGQSHIITVTFEVDAADSSTYDYTITTAETGAVVTNNTGSFSFDEDGRLITTPPPTTQNLTIDFGNGAAVIDIPAANITFNSEKLTFYDNQNSLSGTQNGYESGSLVGLGIDGSGNVIGNFSNGRDTEVATIALATFMNPAGLEKAGNNNYVTSWNSGIPQVGIAGTGERGIIKSSSLEMSNVDLAKEFTEMIVAQRGFQANSKIITTSDEMLQELVNLKR